MNVPQILVVMFLILGVIVHIVNHGKPIDGYYNGIAKFIANSIWAWILYEGGFFS